MRALRTVLEAIGGAAVVLGLGYVLTVGGLDRASWKPAAVPASTPTARAGASSPRPDSFAAVVDAARPAVVNISTIQAGPGRAPRGADPMREFLERYFGEGMPREEPRQSLGSGLIVEAEGYVLTNNHVIQNARMITVRLADEEEYEARVVGRDPRTDLALLKIQGARQLPTVTLGDSDRLRVGDWVLAIGNPFGLEQTVTAGIVSAKGRVIGAGPYDDFIQTDAPINPGNSGGPLFNTRGEVVGINSAIFSQTGGSVGIGFAIPIDLVKELLPQLKTKGRVTRAWLAVSIAAVTPELAGKLGRTERDGALIAEVLPKGPAARAGIRAGDVVVAFQGRPIRRADELPRLTARAPVDSVAELTLVREGKALTVRVRLEELPEAPQG